jgi:hypothetical protein
MTGPNRGRRHATDGSPNNSLIRKSKSDGLQT